MLYWYGQVFPWTSVYAVWQGGFPSVPHYSHSCSSLRESCALPVEKWCGNICALQVFQKSTVRDQWSCFSADKEGKQFVLCLVVCGRAWRLPWEAEVVAASMAKKFCSGACGRGSLSVGAKYLFLQNLYQRSCFCTSPEMELLTRQWSTAAQFSCFSLYSCWLLLWKGTGELHCLFWRYWDSSCVISESQCHMQLCWVCTPADITEDDLEWQLHSKEFLWLAAAAFPVCAILAS